MTQTCQLGRRIGWHVLRHSYCSALVMRGVDLYRVKELAGHASITMTERYSHLSPMAKREGVMTLDQPLAVGGMGAVH